MQRVRWCVPDRRPDGRTDARPESRPRSEPGPDLSPALDAASLLLNDAGKIGDHRDHFDCVGPTLDCVGPTLDPVPVPVPMPVPVLVPGGVVRWLYRRFVS